MLDAYERIGDPNPIAAACTNLGALMLRLGDLADAEIILQRARSIHERRDRANLVQSLLNLAECARLTGNSEKATGRFAEMAARAEEFGVWGAEAVAEGGMGLCALQRGDAEAARVHGMRAQAVNADRTDWFEDRDFVELLLARLEALDGDADAAAARLDAAAAALSTRDVYLWARIELERAHVLRSLDAAAAADIVAGVVSATAAVQSPPLIREITRYRELVASH
jgi:tetratricopeptide (TPR) repeat protein